MQLVAVALSVSLGPVLSYSTYLGGTKEETATVVAVDVAGSARVAGLSYSLDYPVAGAAQPSSSGGGDAVVTRLDPSGTSLVYSTYLGGDSADWGLGLALDAAGNVYVTGLTSSSNFPVKAALQPTRKNGSDAFVATLDAAGALVYSTFLGGNGGDYARSIAANASGEACVLGWTNSADFPTKNPLQPPRGGTYDAFVTCLAPGGQSFVYSTYLGGTGSEDGTMGEIALDPQGAAYVTSYTDSDDFPTLGPLQSARAVGAQCPACPDVFVTKIDPSGALAYSTYLGGIDREFGSGVAVDAAGGAYVVGSTRSSDFPTLRPLQPQIGGLSDLFIARLDPSGSALSFATYLGGTGEDGGGWRSSIAIGPRGDIFVAGAEVSEDFPFVDPVRPKDGVGTFSFVAKLDPQASNILYATALGTSGGGEGAHVAVDAESSAYLTGVTPDRYFPLANPYQDVLKGIFDGFVSKIACPACAAAPGDIGNELKAVKVLSAATALFTWKDLTDASRYLLWRDDFKGGTFDDRVGEVPSGAGGVDDPALSLPLLLYRVQAASCCGIGGK